MSAILLRTLWALGIIVLLSGAYILLNRWRLARLGGRARGLEGFVDGRPGILYFTSPSCQPCKTIQRPALEELAERLGDQIQVIEVDTSERPDLADYWGVLSLPTTFILNAAGEAQGINHGVTRADKLHVQLERALGRPFQKRGENAEDSTQFMSVS